MTIELATVTVYTLYDSILPQKPIRKDCGAVYSYQDIL